MLAEGEELGVNKVDDNKVAERAYAGYPSNGDLRYFESVIKASPCFTREREKEVYSRLLEVRARFFDAEEEYKKNGKDKKVLQKFEAVSGEFGRIRNYIVRHNLKLVISVVKKLRYKGVVGLIDMVQAGAMGLNTALYKFDPEKGRLTTYGSWWIRHHAKRLIANGGKTVRVPVYMQSRVPEFHRVKAELEKQGRGTDEEIAEAMEVPFSSIANVRKALRTSYVYSLDAPISIDKGGGSYKDMVADEDGVSPEANYYVSQVSNLVNDLIDGLESEMEQHIIRSRMDGVTLRAIGEGRGLSRERIRQIEAVAKDKMKTAAIALGISGDDF